MPLSVLLLTKLMKSGILTLIKTPNAAINLVTAIFFSSEGRFMTISKATNDVQDIRPDKQRDQPGIKGKQGTVYSNGQTDCKTANPKSRVSAIQLSYY